MIKDSLKNANTYFNLSENLKKGLEWLINNNMAEISCGKHVIDGDAVYASVQEYETKLNAKYEAHRKYIDIQYMISGKELVGVLDIAKCKTCDAYDENSDLEFLETSVKDEFQNLREGEFLILYPHDAHKPSIADGEKTIVKKVVVKVAID